MVAKLFTKPFGVAGDKTPIPNDTQVDGTVSYQTGFGADYERQLGVDPAAKNIARQTFNELMFDTTTSLQEMQAGFGTSVYNLALAQALPGGGYPKGAVIPSLDGNSFWFNRIPNNATNPDTGGAGWAPLLRYGGYASFSVITTSAALTLGSVNLVSAAGLTPTLPILANTLAGDSVTVAARFDTTIAVSGAGQINYPDAGSTVSFVIRAGEQVCFVSNGSTSWNCAYAVKNPQYQAYTAFTTAGTAAALTLTPQPPIAALAAALRFRVKFSQASTPTSTINVSGTGARLLKQYDSSGAKIPAVYAVNQLSDIEYDGTDWVLFNSLPGGSGVTRPQFDNTTNLATTAFVQGVGLQFSGLYSFAVNSTLTAAVHAGSLIVGNSAGAISITLPAAATMPAKTAIKFWNAGAGVMTLVSAGSDVIATPISVASFLVPQGSWVTLASTGGSAWYVIDNSIQTAIQGTAKNLTLNSTGLNSSVAITTDEIVIESVINTFLVARSVNATASFSTAGAGGLDIGAANSQLASTWYSVWVIGNGVATSTLLSLSATSPTMPAGYTHRARVGWVRTDATANKYPLNFIQVGRRAQYRVGTGTNVTVLPVMANAAASVALWTAIAINSYVPPTAGAVDVGCISQSSASQLAWCYVVPNNSYPTTITATMPAMIGSGSFNSSVTAVKTLMTLEGSNIYWGTLTSGGSTMGVYCAGWEDNL